MRAAKVSRIRRDDDLVEQHELAETAIRKTMKPADHVTNRELRRRRDLVWLLLSKCDYKLLERLASEDQGGKARGMSSAEIASACLYASRSPKQIRKRLLQLKRHQAREQARG